MGPRRLLAFFGHEYALLATRKLSPHTALLPLDIPAIRYAQASGYEWHLPQEWIDHKADYQIFQEATDREHDWFQGAARDFTIADVCWPEFDREAWHYFWRDVSYARALAARWLDSNLEQLILLPPAAKPIPSVSYGQSDVVKLVWAHFLGRRVNWLSSGPVINPTWRWRALRHNARSFLKRFSPYRRRFNVTERFFGDLNVSSDGAAPIVLAFFSGEYPRMSHHIPHLAQGLSRGVVVGLLDADEGTAKKIRTEQRCPVFLTPEEFAPDDEVRTRLERGWQRLQSNCHQPVRDFFDAVAFQFDFACRVRWPVLQSAKDWWLQIWRQLRPAALLVSGLEDAEAQVATLAANQLGLPTIAIPHGDIYTRRTRLAAGYCLFSNELTRQALSWYADHTSLLLPCRGLLPAAEYPTTDAALESHGLNRSAHTNHSHTACRLRVLVIVNPMGVASCLAPYVYLPDQIQLLRDLVHVPLEWKDKITIDFKVHPGKPFSGIEVVEHAVGGATGQILPVNTSISEVLSKYDLFVLLNGYGSVVKPVLRAGRPLVLLWKDAKIGQIGPYELGGLLTQNLLRITSVEDLWVIVRRFVEEPAFAEQMRERARAFARDYLDDSQYPSLAEVVAGVLERRLPCASTATTSDSRSSRGS